MIYKQKPPKGSIRDLMSQLRLADVDRFQADLCRKLNLKVFWSFAKKRPCDFPIERYKIIRDVFLKYGVEI